MNLQKKGPSRRPRNTYMDQVPRRKQMVSMTIVVMKIQMGILAERTKKQRRLVSLVPQREKANPKSDTGVLRAAAILTRIQPFTSPT